MDFIRRLSTKPDTLDEEQIKHLSQRRKSSFAVSARDDEPVLPTAISPAIEIFPGSTSSRQQTLLLSPDQTAKGFIISQARTGNHFLTVATASTSLPGTSHTKHFYGTLSSPRVKTGRKDSDSSADERGSTKICTLTRDALSFRRCHHVDDPYNDRRLIEMEFSTSSWNTGELKASMVLLNKYSEAQPIEPVKLRWKGKKTSLEGVLEWKHRPVAVCASGPETEEGEYVLYVAPGMDTYVCCIIIMAVDDRVRRGSEEKDTSNLSRERRGSVQI